MAESITFTSPLAGAIYAPGNTIVVTFNSNIVVEEGSFIDIMLYNPTTPNPPYIIPIKLADYNVGLNTFNFPTPPGLPVGNYCIGVRIITSRPMTIIGPFDSGEFSIAI